MSDQETQEIEQGIAEATYPDGPWEFGHYVERNDSGDWVPLICGEMTEDQAREHHLRNYLPNETFRNSRVVRRAVSPWELWR